MKSKLLKPRLLLLLIWPLWAFAHPFYFSLTKVDLNPQSHALEVTIKLFTNDIEQALEAQNNERLDLGGSKESPNADQYLEAYLRNRLQFEVNGQKMEYNYLGKEVELDVLWAYVEIEKVPAIEKIEVLNSMLVDKFETQQNVVQFRIANKKRSMLLHKDHTREEVEFTD